MTWQTIVEPSCGDDDWFAIRDCFVRAFHHYPLYKYMIPDEKKRPEFLKNYLEAVYDVTVRNGSSIVLSIKMKSESNEITMIGGVLFVPPSKTTGGWQCDRDEDFWDAYQKYNLKNIDQEAFTRLQRYEEWEYEHISKKVCAIDTPMWNGIFCAIDPKYAGQGCGSISYSECIKLISNPATLQSTTSKKSWKALKTKVRNVLKKFNTLIGSKLPSRFDNKFSVTSPTVTPPTLFVLSHSRSAVRFHQKNGLQLVTSLPYELNDSNNVPFEVSVLLLTLTSESSSDETLESKCIAKRSLFNECSTKLVMKHLRLKK